MEAATERGPVWKKTDPVAPLPSSQPDRMTQYATELPSRRTAVHDDRVMDRARQDPCRPWRCAKLLSHSQSGRERSQSVANCVSKNYILLGTPAILTGRSTDLSPRGVGNPRQTRLAAAVLAIRPTRGSTEEVQRTTYPTPTLKFGLAGAPSLASTKRPHGGRHRR